MTPFTMATTLFIYISVITLTNAVGISRYDIKGFLDIVIENDKRRTGVDWISQNVSNVHQCVRMCWLYKKCAGVTYTTYTQAISKCALHPDWSIVPSSQLVDDLSSTFIDLKSLSLQKSNTYGCDNRPCKETELCVPTFRVETFKCLPLVTTLCPDKPPQVTNAIATLDGFSIVTYTCADGYVRSGRHWTSTCDHILGTWSSPDVECTFLDCGRPRAVDNADMLYTKTYYGSQVQYSCYLGHTSPTISRPATCQDNGLWSHVPDDCTLVVCGPPRPVSNGDVAIVGQTGVMNSGNTVPTLILNVAVGAMSNHTCRPGFTSQSGFFISECEPGGQWSLDVRAGFECTALVCGDPPSLLHARLEYKGTSYLSQATYTCEIGYQMTGADRSVLTCRESGTWEGDVLTCEIVNCGHPPELTGGNVAFNDTTFGSTGVYSCNSPLVFSGLLVKEMRSRCLGNGQWSSNGVLECIAIPCGAVPEIGNGSSLLVLNSPPVFHVSFECAQGFILKGQDVVVCATSDPWNVSHISCDVIDCGDPPAVLHSSVDVSSRGFNGTATYTCVAGYRLKVSSPLGNVAHCSDNGQWSFGGIRCEQILCDDPPNINNASFQLNSTLPLTLGTKVKYICDDGFVMMSTNNTIVCESQGWSTTTHIRCIWIICGPPPTEEKASSYVIAETTNDTIYTFIATYKCAEGYELVNGTTNKRLCERNSWTTNYVRCKPVDCGTPPELDNGRPSSSNTTFGSGAIYWCNTGFKLFSRGSFSQNQTVESVCQANGVWSDINSTCVIVDCGNPNPLPNTWLALTTNSTTYNSIVVYTCVTEHNMTSTVSWQSICTANGQWLRQGNTSSYECECPSSIPEVLNGTGTFTSRLIGAVATYTCHEGYRPVENGSHISECTSLGQWSTPSNCVPVDCGIPEFNISSAIYIATGTTYMSRVTFICQGDSYLTDNNISSTCLATGQWSAVDVECTLLQCELIKIEHGSMSALGKQLLHPNLTLEATYSCDEDFRPLYPNLTLRCEFNETLGKPQWSHAAGSLCAQVNWVNPMVNKDTNAFSPYTMEVPVYPQLTSLATELSACTTFRKTAYTDRLRVTLSNFLDGDKLFFYHNPQAIRYRIGTKESFTTVSISQFTTSHYEIESRFISGEHIIEACLAFKKLTSTYEVYVNGELFYTMGFLPDIDPNNIVFFTLRGIEEVLNVNVFYKID